MRYFRGTDWVFGRRASYARERIYKEDNNLRAGLSTPDKDGGLSRQAVVLSKGSSRCHKDRLSHWRSLHFN